MGTPNYMSPEQVQGHAVDGRADQFSLAVAAYEVLTGEKPFVADQLPALLFRIVREDPVPPQRLNPTLTPQVEVVLRKALSKSAADRYPTCAEFVEALIVACDLNPHWRALPRAVAHSLPTIGGGATAGGAPHRLPEPPRTPESRASVPPPAFLDTTQRERNARSPILKSLAWMLVGIGLVGLVLFGAQKYLFNRYSESAPQTAVTASPSDSSATKPSPMGDSAGAAHIPPKADSPPETTAPETTKPESPAPEISKPERAVVKQPSETPASPADPRARTAPPPSITPKPETEQQVQFVTEPAGAQLTVDNNTSQSCRTPCLLSLLPGRHSISVHLDGYRPYPRIFSVPEEREIFLQLSKASGTLSVTSSPAGASIEINGEPQTKRTPAIFNFPPGNYRVKVTRSGAFLEFDVAIRDGEFVNKKVDF
jgi:hypothetical protein